MGKHKPQSLGCVDPVRQTKALSVKTKINTGTDLPGRVQTGKELKLQ